MTTETQCCTTGTVTAGKVHAADCKPDALTRLEEAIKSLGDLSDSRTQSAMCEEAMSIHSDARKEMEGLRAENELLRGDVSMWMGRERKALLECSAAETKLTHANATAATLSNKMGDSVRQGQQQGRVELAQEILQMIFESGYIDTERHLQRIVGEDAGK